MRSASMCELGQLMHNPENAYPFCVYFACNNIRFVLDISQDMLYTLGINKRKRGTQQ